MNCVYELKFDFNLGDAFLYAFYGEILIHTYV